jgi:hypothetical protein
VQPFTGVPALSSFRIAALSGLGGGVRMGGCMRGIKSRLRLGIVI